MNDSQKKITEVCDQIKDMLLEKNMKYGDSALNPVRFLSNSSPIEQILVRIDDKINRIKQGFGNVVDDEDVIKDLIGYFILLKVAVDSDKETHDKINERRSFTKLLDLDPDCFEGSVKKEDPWLLCDENISFSSTVDNIDDHLYSENVKHNVPHFRD